MVESLAEQLGARSPARIPQATSSQYKSASTASCVNIDWNTLRKASGSILLSSTNLAFEADLPGGLNFRALWALFSPSAKPRQAAVTQMSRVFWLAHICVSLPLGLAVKELKWTTYAALNCIKIFKILKMAFVSENGVGGG